jgi:hypothetical protein
LSSNDQGNGNDDSGNEDVVFERRLEKRLRRIHEGDRPWLRRLAGISIILFTLVVGWRLTVSRNKEIAQSHRTSKHQSRPESKIESESGTHRKDAEGPALEARKVDLREAFLDAPAVSTIAECTKGIDAFRLLNLSVHDVAKGGATLDSVFAPALNPKSPGVKRQVNLINIRILDASGTEVRLHAIPEGESGKLRTKLFGADSEGLPDPDKKFSAEVEKFRDQPFSLVTERAFMEFAKNPGKLLETETHEVFSFRDRSGIQIIRSNGHIAELQLFAKQKFLACTTQIPFGGEAKVECKCLDRSR